MAAEIIGFESKKRISTQQLLQKIHAALDAGERRIVSFFPQVRVHKVPAETFAAIDPHGVSFRNINTPQEYFGLRGAGLNVREPRPGEEARGEG